MGGCQDGKPAQQVSSNTWFPLALGGQEIRVQLALTPQEQQKGLMHREQLASDHGMLFVFEAEDQMGFWMLNTKIPLDIGYFNKEGVLQEIYLMYPHDRASVGSISKKIKYALEMNQGWFATYKVRPGARMDMQELRHIIQMRKR